MSDPLTVAVDPAIFQTDPRGMDAAMLAELRRRIGIVQRTAGAVGQGAIVGSEHLMTGTVTSSALYVGSVDADLIQGFHIAANQIAVGHMNVATLSAISGDLGVIFAGIVTGAVLQTASANPRVRMDSTGLWAHDGVSETFRIDATDGSMTSLKGTITGTTVQTAKTGSRVVMDGTGIRGYNAANVLKFQFDTTTGLGTFAGALSTEIGSSVDGQYIVAASVTAGKLTVAQLSSITADLGTVNSGAINGLTITGSTVRTSSTNPKVQMDATGLGVYDSTGAVTVGLPASGDQPYFRGRLDARGGLDLQGATTSPAGSTSKARYLKPSDQSEIAAVYGTVAGYVAGQTAGGALRVSATSGGNYKDRIIATAGLWGYWRLGSLTSADESGNARSSLDSLLGERAPTVITGLIAGSDSALSFPAGLDSVLRNGTAFSPTFAPAGASAIECWARLTGTPGVVTALKSGGVALLSVDSGGKWKAQIQIGGTLRTITTTTTASTTAGDLLQLDYDGTTVRLYVNNVLAGSVAATGAPAAISTLEVGNIPATGAPGIVVDEVALYTASLSSGSRADHLQTGQTGVSTSAVTRERVLLDSDGGSDFDVDWTKYVFPHFNDPATATNFSTISQQSTEMFGGRRESTGAQNAEVGWDVVLSAGSWKVSLIYQKNNDKGIYTVSLDGTTVGTIDGYNASVLNAQQASVGPFTVAVGGKKRLLFKMATKNGSAISYHAVMHGIQLRRTA